MSDTPSQTVFQTDPESSLPNASAGAGEAAPEASPPEPDLEARLQRFVTRPLDAHSQQELAQLLHLRVAGAGVLGDSAQACLQLAVRALLVDKPNLRLVRDLRKRLEAQLTDRLHPLRLSAILRTDSPAVQVMLGLLCSLLLALPLGVCSEVLRLQGGIKLLGYLDLHLMSAVMLVGLLGSTTSILVRIRDFDQVDASEPTAKLMLGFTKPLVGAAFALFGLLLFKSNVLPIVRLPSQDPLAENSFFLAMAFVLGFSERLAQDLISQVEERVEGEDKAIHTPPTTDVLKTDGDSSKG